MLAPTYTALEDYALAHGVPVSAFQEAKWTEGIHNGRPCLFVPHEDGIVRVRFLDGEQPKWLPIKPDGMTDKIVPCWYGFKRAIDMAKEADHKTLALCNGQPSVITAQYYGIAALAQTDGEGKKIEQPLLKRLLAAVKEHELKIIVAMDGDDTGRNATKDRQAQLQANGIQVSIVYFGGDDGYDLADYCKQHKTDIITKLIKLSKYNERELTPVVTGKELAFDFETMIRFPTKSLPTGEMVITPMKGLHEWGGLATMLLPGMMTEVMGPSGGGKTSFMETWLDVLRQRGFESLWYSPEWIPKTMHYRTLQRYGGAYADDIWASVLWHKEQANGIPESKREGRPLKYNSKAGQLALKTNSVIRKWPGDIHCFQSVAVTETVLEDMSKRLHRLRRDDKRIGVAFFDYAQLLHTVTEEAGRNSYEIIISKIKQWSKENCIHSIVGSQVTKEKARQCIDQGRLMGKYDSHWVAPNEFNLILSLNIQYDGVDPITQEPVKTNRAIVNVCKNSTGQEGTVQMVTDFPHLRWIDKRWTEKTPGHNSARA